ncbi:MAG: RpiB/LacA/LacB family sugar-phosphate isomerase, partial [Myxococcaceae bacterium]|nr:RpiB/LacA/LacB family sugar-phosphate isomerase [Myxococcaceae bacterium]
MSTIAIAADHAGVSLKAELVAELKKLGHEVVDLGPAT